MYLTADEIFSDKKAGWRSLRYMNILKSRLWEILRKAVLSDLNDHDRFRDKKDNRAI